MNYQLINFLYESGIFACEPMANQFFPLQITNFSEIPYLHLEQNLNIPFQWAQEQSLNFQGMHAQRHIIRNSIPETSNQNQTISRRKSGRRHTNQETEISSAKRNAEQNIINQFFSYYNDSHISLKAISKILKIMGIKEGNLSKPTEFIYALIRTLNNRRKRKYMSRRYLLKLFYPQKIEELLPEIKQKVQLIEGLDLNLVCSFFRRLVQSFFKATYQSGVMTSRRITCVSKEHHLGKLRKLKNLTANLGQNQKEFPYEEM